MELTRAQKLMLDWLLAQKLSNAPLTSAGPVSDIRNMTASEIMQGLDRKTLHEDQFGYPTEEGDEVVTVIRTRRLTYTGPQAWVNHTIARSIDGVLQCGPGKTVASDEGQKA